MEHLLNCHGELAMLISALGSLPVLAPALRALHARWDHQHTEVKS